MLVSTKFLKLLNILKINNMCINNPFRKGMVNINNEIFEVNYRFVDEETIEMYTDTLEFIGYTHYKSLLIE